MLQPGPFLAQQVPRLHLINPFKPPFNPRNDLVNQLPFRFQPGKLSFQILPLSFHCETSYLRNSGKHLRVGLIKLDGKVIRVSQK